MMGGPLHRGSSGGRISNLDSSDLRMKDRTDKEDTEKGRFSSDHASPSDRSFLDQIFANYSSKSGYTDSSFGFDPFGRGNMVLQFIRFSLVLVVFVALSGSVWWMLSVSTTPKDYISKGNLWFQERIISELAYIGEISMGSSKLKEVEFCSEDFENYVPCFNRSENIALGYSDGKEYDRQCTHASKRSCSVLPPNNYKIPLSWPTGRDVIWFSNVKISAQEVLSSGSLTKRMMMLEDNQISFLSGSAVEEYSDTIAKMIGLTDRSTFNEAGIRTVLDIGCGYGSFGAHLVSKQVLTMCIADYEASGSQVQLTLERGLPGMIGSFISKQLPYPSLSFDMLHCAWCGIDWNERGGIYLVEADRVLRPGGYFIWTSPLVSVHGSFNNKENQKKWNDIQSLAENLCWVMLSQQEETVVWKKTSKKACYASRKHGSNPPICSKGYDVESTYYQPLQMCIGGTRSRHWVPIEERTIWPSRAKLNANELKVYDVKAESFAEDGQSWKSAVEEYWPLLSPLIFSDHPKRPDDKEFSPPPFNMLRNVLDMNAHLGGFNQALLEYGKSVWVMNVVPTTAPNHLPLILDRGFVGVMHDWCEAFPTYPRTYDMVHGAGLLSLESKKRRCSFLDIFTEIDRLLRPEGWVILRDTVSLIESARVVTSELRWDARMVETGSDDDERILICQKPFFKQQSQK